MRRPYRDDHRIECKSEADWIWIGGSGNSLRSEGSVAPSTRMRTPIVALQDLWFGIEIARKGWLTREDVMNCLPLNEISKRN